MYSMLRLDNERLMQQHQNFLKSLARTQAGLSKFPDPKVNQELLRHAKVKVDLLIYLNDRRPV